MHGRVHWGDQPAGGGPTQSLRPEAGKQEDRCFPREEPACLYISVHILPPAWVSLSSTSIPSIESHSFSQAGNSFCFSELYEHSAHFSYETTTSPPPPHITVAYFISRVLNHIVSPLRTRAELFWQIPSTTPGSALHVEAHSIHDRNGRTKASMLCDYAPRHILEPDLWFRIIFLHMDLGAFRRPHVSLSNGIRAAVLPNRTFCANGNILDLFCPGR